MIFIQENNQGKMVYFEVKMNTFLPFPVYMV